MKDILPSQQGEPDTNGRKPIYTDVTIDPERYLFGGSDLSPQIVRVFGGRVSNLVETYDDEPTFTVTERVLVFVIPYIDPISGNTTSIFRVADFRWKYRIDGNIAIQDRTNKTEQLSQN